jgi:hypothetical protein
MNRPQELLYDPDCPECDGKGYVVFEVIETARYKRVPCTLCFNYYVVEIRAAVAALRRLIASLPKCDQCQLPATRAWVRGADRYCDDHGNPEQIVNGGVPEYPRAFALRNAVTALVAIDKELVKYVNPVARPKEET